MIRRFDTNGNNMIDPSEAQGPAQFFLQRMASRNPNIDLSKPIPIDKLGAEINAMRGGGPSGGDSDPRSRGGSSSSAPELELLVPDFSSDVEMTPPEGFGAASAIYAVRVEDRDKKEAEERMRRYDRDRNGQLSREELGSGRWSDDPMQYDRNRDGQLSASELAVRYANRRLAEQERRSASGSTGERDRGSWGRGGDSGWGRGGDDWRRSDSRDKKESEVSRFGEAKSYRLSSGSDDKISGLPDFFARSDANGDGQVMMNEFSSSWNQETLAEFQKWDLNRDGIILPSECATALDRGSRVGNSSSGSTSTATRSTASSKPAIGGTQMEWAKRQIQKYDQNRDGQLTAKEWENMLIKPVGADANGDGVLTVEEYAAFRARKE